MIKWIIEWSRKIFKVEVAWKVLILLGCLFDWFILDVCWFLYGGAKTIFKFIRFFSNLLLHKLWGSWCSPYDKISINDQSKKLVKFNLYSSKPFEERSALLKGPGCSIFYVNRAIAWKVSFLPKTLFDYLSILFL